MEWLVLLVVLAVLIGLATVFLQVLRTFYDRKGSIATLSTFLLMTSCVMAEENVPASYWSFDEGHKLNITGCAKHVTGVRGSALKFDGFTTRVTSKLDEAVDVTRGFTVEAWIAPQEYSWNWTGLVDQEQGHREGFSFGINHLGQVGLGLAINGKWQTLLSKDSIPLLKWSHVAATFDPTDGIVVYINGQPAGKSSIQSKALLTLNGQPVAEGKAFRVGYRRRLEGVDLIAWIKIESRQPLNVSIETK